MSHEESCLVTKLSHYHDLDDASRHHLARLEEAEESYERGDDVLTTGEKNDRLMVVKKGWLYSYTDLPDGRRQVVKIHHPGDIIGFADLAYHTATTNLRAAESCMLCPFPKDGLTEVFQDCPQLASLLFAISMRDQTVLVDMIRAIGRMSAMEKIAFFLLDMQARLRITNRLMTDTIRMPLNQSEIADTVGLTNVYVSRTFMRMEEDNLIRRNGIEVTIARENKLVEITDFKNRYHKLDSSWFPQGASNVQHGKRSG